jgi:WXXGXW repeat (2 copies)
MTRNKGAIRWLLLAIVVLTYSAASFSQIAVGVSVRIGPPALPVYAQPICPGPGYFWTPGYWAWNDDEGYYWVPGTWVVAPVGMLWTPGYWGWGGGFYAWHAGYWGPHIGFYGGINYGFGYTGVGFFGGEWRGREFYYNRSVTNVSVTNVTRVYNRTVVVNNTRNVSYNGGAGGVAARPTHQEEMAAHEQHVGPVGAQTQHERLAGQNRQNFASQNHGRPAVAATARAGDFSSHSAVPARAAGGEYHAPAVSPREARVGARPANSGTSNGTSNGFRPFTPPSKNGGAAGNTAHGYENRSNASRPMPSPLTPSRSNEMRPQNGSSMARPAPQPRNAPRQNSYRPSPPRSSSPPPRPSAPPRNQSAPKDEHHKGR